MGEGTRSFLRGNLEDLYMRRDPVSNLEGEIGPKLSARTLLWTDGTMSRRLAAVHQCHRPHSFVGLHGDDRPLLAAAAYERVAHAPRLDE